MSLKKHFGPEFRSLCKDFLIGFISLYSWLIHSSVCYFIRYVLIGVHFAIESSPGHNCLLNGQEIRNLRQFLSSEIPDIDVAFEGIVTGLFAFLFFFLFSFRNSLKIFVTVQIIKVEGVYFLGVIFELVDLISQNWKGAIKSSIFLDRFASQLKL